MERLTVQKFRVREGLEAKTRWREWLERMSAAESVPTLCTSHCEAEPDGECQHGHPSVLVAVGLL